MKTKFGILGCGGIARRFAEALRLSESGELYAAAARDEARAQELVDTFGGQKAYGSYLDLIMDENVEIVYISLVHSGHYEAAKLCVEHGKSVLCEKPFFVTEADAVKLVALAREKGVLIMEAMWTRCLPAYQKAKEWARNGAIGEIKFIDAAFCFRFPFSPQHRLYNPETAGGALLDAGVYPYEFITGILEEKPAEIKGVALKAPTGVDETISMTMRFESGVLANAVASMGVRMSETAHIYGTKGYVKAYRFLGSRKCELRNEQDEVVLDFTDDHKEGFVYEIEHIVDLYRRKMTESPLIPLEDSIDFVRTADLVRRQCGLS